MPATIREKILEHLRLNRTASVAALAFALDVTKADIRYHLKPLLGEGLVEIEDRESTQSNKARGRPKASFRLTSSARANNLQALASALLHEFYSAQSVDPEERSSRLARLLFSLPADEGDTLIQRLTRLVDQLRESHYEPRWEAHSAGPRILFENCPYAAILAEFPQLCEMDRQYISQFSGLRTELLQTLNTSKRKPPACVFRLTIR